MPKRSAGLPEEYAAHGRAVGRAIGRRIRVRRGELQLSQERVRAQMALEHVFVSRSAFSRIEAGESLPDAAQLMALIAVLRVTCSWLLFGPEESITGSSSRGVGKQA